MKRPSLKPRGSRCETSPWMINIPASMSGTGKRQRYFFASKKDAEEYGKRQKQRVENYGTAAVALSPGQLEEAAAAFEEIKPLGVSLKEAVIDYVKRHRQR